MTATKSSARMPSKTGWNGAREKNPFLISTHAKIVHTINDNKKNTPIAESIEAMASEVGLIRIRSKSFSS